MAYSSTQPVACIVENFGSGPAVFLYSSSHVSSDIAGPLSVTSSNTTLASSDYAALQIVGFFKGCGVGSYGLQGQGMKPGDLVINRCSTSAFYPGITTLHSVIASTPNAASTLASSAWPVAYDITVAPAAL